LLSAHDTLPESALKKVDVSISKGDPPKKFVAAVNDLIRCSDFFSRWLRGWDHQAAAWRSLYSVGGFCAGGDGDTKISPSMDHAGIHGPESVVFSSIYIRARQQSHGRDSV